MIRRSARRLARTDARRSTSSIACRSRSPRTRRRLSRFRKTRAGRAFRRAGSGKTRVLSQRRALERMIGGRVWLSPGKTRPHLISAFHSQASHRVRQLSGLDVRDDGGGAESPGQHEVQPAQRDFLVRARSLPGPGWTRRDRRPSAGAPIRTMSSCSARLLVGSEQPARGRHSGRGQHPVTDRFAVAESAVAA